MNDLPWELAQQNSLPDDALELAEASLEDEPENVDRLDTKAFVLMRMGKLAEAQRLLEQERANGGGGDPLILEHFGDLSAAKKQAADAQANWRLAMDVWNQMPAGARDAEAVARLAAKIKK